jgi:hypothetical protein
MHFRIIFLLLLSIGLSVNVYGASEETLSEFFFRRRMFKIADDGQTIIEGKRFGRFKDDVDLKQVWAILQNQKQLTPPHAVKIIYADETFCRVQESVIQLNLVDPADRAKSTAASLEEYMAFAQQQIQHAVTENHRNLQVVTFEDAQKSSFISLKTLAGEQIRLYGLTESIQNEIFREIKAFLSSKYLFFSKALYFGSRVMPRAELLKRDTSLVNRVPIQDDGVQKSSIRVGGLTSLSDLEIAVTFASEHSHTDKEIKNLANEFKTDIQNRFFIFPISVKLFQVEAQMGLDDQFATIQKKIQSRNKVASPFQFVEVPQVGFKVEPREQR